MDILKHQFPIKSLIFLKSNCHAKMAPDIGRAITLGCWFSVGPAMLATEKGRALTAKMPRDRLLTETDGPFAQMRGKAAVPWDTAQVIPILGHIWNESSAGVERQLTANLRRLTTKV